MKNTKKKFKPVVINCALLGADAYDALCDALLKVPFDLISIPVYAKKSLLFENQPENTKSTIVGYVKTLCIDDDNNISFDIVLYNSFAETISALEDKHVTITTINDKDGNLKTITKINIEA